MKICIKTVNFLCYGGLCYIKQLLDKYFWLFVITEQHAFFDSKPLEVFLSYFISFSYFFDKKEFV